MGITKTVLAFIAGAICGGVATYFVTRDVERERADSEIESMKAYYDKKEQKLSEQTQAAEKKAEAAVKAKNSYEETVINLGATLESIQKERGKMPSDDEEDDEGDEETEDD